MNDSAAGASKVSASRLDRTLLASETDFILYQVSPLPIHDCHFILSKTEILFAVDHGC